MISKKFLVKAVRFEKGGKNMLETVRAIYKNVVFHPIEPPGMEEGQRVLLIIAKFQEPTVDDMLELAYQVYCGLFDEDIEKIEKKLSARLIKRDRLNRTLLNIARIMETFEKREVSFSTVTLQFNSTNPMDLLAINILLSRIWFEVRLPSQRTRVRIWAARRKYKWMNSFLQRTLSRFWPLSIPAGNWFVETTSLRDLTTRLFET